MSYSAEAGSRPAPGYLCTSPSATEPYNSVSWSPELLAPEELLLIPELLVVGSGPGKKTRHVVSA